MSKPQGYVDPSFPDPNGPDDAPIIIYGYTPSAVVCILAIVLFSISLGVHGWLSVKYRAWYFLPVCVACIMEIGGYAFRYLSATKNPYRVTYFVVQYFLIIVAPVLISASIYVCLTKLINRARNQGFATAWLRPKLILWGFITADVVTTVAQVTGAAMIGKAESNREDPTTANNIVLAGLAIQTFAFTVFLLLFISLVVSMARVKQLRQQFVSVVPFICGLGLASVMVYLRTIFRLAETSQGVLGYLMTHEIFFVVLEFVPIVIAVIVLAVFYPGRCLKSVSSKSLEGSVA